MRKPELLQRTRRFALDVIGLHGRLPNKPESWVLGRQVLKSGTSIGANYREAQRSRSPAEFVSKVHISLQEAEETAYWFELFIEGNIGDKAEAQRLLQEVTELSAILAAIASSAQQ